MSRKFTVIAVLVASLVGIASPASAAPFFELVYGGSTKANCERVKAQYSNMGFNVYPCQRDYKTVGYSFYVTRKS